jgi:hypothetical protein
MLDKFRKKIQSAIQAFNESTIFRSQGNENNNYKSHDKQVEAIHLKYSNLAEYACHSVRTIVDFRAAATMSKSFNVSIAPGYEREKIWLEEFIKYNNLHGSNYVKYGRLGEKEGKVVINLRPTKEQSGVKIKLVALPYRIYKYDVVLNSNGELDSIVYTVNRKEFEIKADRISYVILTGTGTNGKNDYIITPPIVAGILTHLDNADRAMQDLRQIGFLFASPTPFFKTQSWNDAKIIKQIVTGTNQQNASSDPADRRKFKVGKTGFAGPLDFSYVSAPMQGAEMLLKEVTTNTQIVSGATGIPVFMLGFPELIGAGRATAAEMTDNINIATNTERTIWQESWLEIIKKSVALHNQFNADTLNPEAFEKVTIPVVSISHMLKIKDLFENAVINGIISKETYYEKLDDIDPVVEKERLREEKQSLAQADNSMMTENLAAIDELMKPIPLDPNGDNQDG